MKQKWIQWGLGLLLATGVIAGRPARAESQGSEYKGITDPFGDPQNYEFSEDEKNDKEWFHLGRFLMVGLDGGGAVFTGGLGATVNPGFYVGIHLVYFFDRSLALDAGVHYSNHLDSILPKTGERLDLDTNMIPITLGLRWYFDVRGAPKAIAVANPFIAAGGGLYLRTQNQIDQIGFSTSGTANTTNFGAYAGGGIEFAIYERHVYLGIDLRYHFVFFVDADQTYGGILPAGSRAGNYFTPALSITYSW